MSLYRNITTLNIIISVNSLQFSYCCYTICISRNYTTFNL